MTPQGSENRATLVKAPASPGAVLTISRFAGHHGPSSFAECGTQVLVESTIFLSGARDELVMQLIAGGDAGGQEKTPLVRVIATRQQKQKALAHSAINR